MLAAGSLFQVLADAAGRLPAWGRCAAVLAVVAVLVRGRLKPGYAFFMGAVLVALAFGQELEPFANALNQGATGVPTVRLLVTLLAIAWLGEVLSEGAAGLRLEEAARRLLPDPRVRAVVAPVLGGLLPFPAGAAPSPDSLPLEGSHRAALHLWFGRLGGLVFPAGAGLVVACDLSHVPLGRAAALMAPLAIAMAAVGLLTLARSLPSPAEPAGPPAPAPGAGGRLTAVLVPAALLAAGAFWIPQTAVPEIRSAVVVRRVAEGLLGLTSPVALGALLAGLVAGRGFGISAREMAGLMRRVFTVDLVVFAVGIKVLEQCVVASPAGRELASLAVGGIPAAAPLAFLGLPALMGFLLGGPAEGLAATLPFLAPLAGANPAEPGRLLVLAYAGAFLGSLFSGEILSAGSARFGPGAAPGALRWRLALPASATALLVAVLTSVA